MVSHERVAKRVEHYESEDRAQRRDKKCRRDLHTSPNVTPCEINRRAQSDARDQPDVGERIVQLNRPLRINERQLGRPKQFAQIEPRRVSSNDQALQRSKRKHRPQGALMITFPPDRHQTHR